jgi:hypothetical protein
MSWGRALVLLLGLASLLASALMGLLWHAYYWVHRDCIEEAWRIGGNGCFVASESVTYSGSASVLIWPAMVLLLLTLLCFWRAAMWRKSP